MPLPHMVLQTALLNKRFTAYSARMSPLIEMYHDMRLQIIPPSERLATEAARKPPQRRMLDRMLAQSVLRRECHITEVAFVRFLAQVHYFLVF